MSWTDFQRHIVETANKHRGRYLLPRRFRPSNPPSDLDREYAACQGLVDGGHAIWLRGSELEPGILLTGKPEEPRL